MTRARIFFLSILLPLSAMAQQPGVLTEWDVQKVIETIASQTARMQPLIAEIHPAEWTAKGAPDAYIQQWEAVRTEAQTLKRSSDSLVHEPARLTTAMDTYFRLQDLEGSLGSLIEGVRKYQNPALADLLRGVLAENDSSRRQLRQYVVDLAAVKEQEFKVMDKEAQRCREAVTRPGKK
jgi:hypothetical protein